MKISCCQMQASQSERVTIQSTCRELTGYGVDKNVQSSNTTMQNLQNRSFDMNYYAWTAKRKSQVEEFPEPRHKYILLFGFSSRLYPVSARNYSTLITSKD